MTKLAPEWVITYYKEHRGMGAAKFAFTIKRKFILLQLKVLCIKYLWFQTTIQKYIHIYVVIRRLLGCDMYATRRSHDDAPCSLVRQPSMEQVFMN